MSLQETAEVAIKRIRQAAGRRHTRTTAKRFSCVILDRILAVYRIGDPNGAHPIFDATGSKLHPGRWNTAINLVVYASEHYSTATLEKLAHGSGSLPPNQHWIDITIPNGITYEAFSVAHMPMWADPACTDAKAFGAD